MSKFNHTSEQRAAGFALLTLGALGLVACFLPPVALRWLPQCPLHALTGFYCPGCGATRMLYFLCHGHLRLAFEENALAMISLPAIVCNLALQLAGWRMNLNRRTSFRLGTAVAAIVLVFGVARNLPVPLSRSLAPQAVGARTPR
jgi:hypothetical protein